MKNLSGEAFDGKINGNISYNISNGHIGVAFKGVGMDAEKAIAGSAGLKNALSGKLNFNANVTLHGATQTAMMKNLKVRLHLIFQMVHLAISDVLNTFCSLKIYSKTV